MGPSKSLSDHLIELYSSLLADTVHLSTEKDLVLDLRCITQRIRYEGPGFATKTMPKLGKALDRGLVEGVFQCPASFSTHKDTSIPEFLRRYFEAVFDKNGVLLENASVECVKALRQMLFFAYKVELPYSSSQEDAVITAFVRAEEELDYTLNEEYEAVIHAASYITRRVFSDFDPKDISPRHGPGAVSTGEKLDNKWMFSRLYDKIHQVYPYYNYFIVGGARELIDRISWYKKLERSREGVAKVVLVNKDSRGPRLISAEPLEFQWIQQGLGRKIVDHLESYKLTRGHINFRDQSVNRALALTSSLDGEFATLDMKEASDRVSLKLVQQVFSQTPALLRALEASRSDATRLPDGRVIALKKFAPMGSALCFPVEAYVFWAIIVAKLARVLRVDIWTASRFVFVYGDDIIVPTRYTNLVVEALETFALKVNVDKSCASGHFRESCGMDAFYGVPVTPVRLRKDPSTASKTNGLCLASLVATANQLQREYPATAEYLYRVVEKHIGKLPYAINNSPYIGRLADSFLEAMRYNIINFKWRVNKDYQRIEFKGFPRLSSRKYQRTVSDWPRLLRDLLSGAPEDPMAGVIPRSSRINRNGWTSI